MPSDPSVPVIDRPFVSRRGEAPVTLFLDAEDAVRVTVVTAPDVSSPAVARALFGFSRACHSDVPPEAPSGGVEADVASGRVLWQSAEVLDWVLLVEGIDRNVSHQMVRQRVGVTFSQQCTGDRDCRHDDAVVPRAYVRRPAALERYVRTVLEAKASYAADVDDGVMVGEARRLLPNCLTTFLYWRVCLSALGDFFRKREDVMTQDWLTRVLALRVREAVLRASPWAEAALRPAPARGSFYDRIKRTGRMATHLWSPAGTDHDDWPWNPATFEHGALSHEEVSSGPDPFVPRLYEGVTDRAAAGHWEQPAVLLETGPSALRAAALVRSRRPGPARH